MVDMVMGDMGIIGMSDGDGDGIACITGVVYPLFLSII